MAYADNTFSRRRFRRRVALWSFVCGIPVPTLIVVAGMTSDQMAARVSTMSAVLLAVFSQAVAISGWYMKLGSDESRKDQKE